MIGCRKSTMSNAVSVVMPTYNGSAFVADSLASVFTQTMPADEIIVVDDHSTDETAAVVEAIAREAPVALRLLVLPTNNGGPSRPFNVGIEAAKNEVIALLEQDDLMRPGRLAAQLRAVLDCPQVTAVTGRFAILGRSDNDMAPMWPEPQLHDLDDHID